METVNTKEKMPKEVHYKTYVVRSEHGFPIAYVEIETMWYERATTLITADGIIYPVATGGAVKRQSGCKFSNSIICENWEAVG